MLKKLIIGFTPYTTITHSLVASSKDLYSKTPTLKIALSSPGNSIFIGHASNPP
jgi:hypothetical protein